jgi:hypothetical protein
LIYGTIDKRYLLSIFLIFITLSAFGQGNKDSLSNDDFLNTFDSLYNKENLPIYDKTEGSVHSIIHLYDSRTSYIYNQSKDTIQLSNIAPHELCFCSAPKVISEIQIDGKGAKELVFYRTCEINSIFYKCSFPQMSKTIIKKYEIWNLDTKQLLFEAKNYFKSHFKNEIIGFSKQRYERGRRYYQYHFKINKEGNIQIRSLRGKEQAFADNKKGTYTFINEKYELKE